jgi:long-chain acyl-CoA synthetase
LTLDGVLAEHRRSYPERTAVACRDHRYTYPELDARVSRLANALRSIGLGPGDRVLWLGQNCHRLLECLLAAARSGSVFCAANWRQTAEELAFVIDDLQPSVVIWQEDEIGPAVQRARNLARRAATWIQHDTHASDGYEGLVASASGDEPAVQADPGSPVLQMYTAAFSGRPNGALLSHTAIIVQSLMMARLQEIDWDYVYLNSGPLFHVATLMTTMATFQLAGTNVFTPRVEADELCRLIERERCTGAFLIGPTINQILELNRDRRYDLKSLRTFGGRPEWNEMITVDTSPWGKRPGGYGQTEVMGMLTFGAVGGPGTGSAGRPSPVAQVRIVDPEGNEVAPGEVGEIVARGPTVMAGYHDRPNVNAERQAGGWHHTNDLGRREPDGSISFVGPKTRLIKSAAENIYPAEVEGCISRHPAVAEAAVIGVPDPKWTQSVKAVVVLKPDSTASEEDIIEHCRASIASYKKPRSVEFIERLPRQGFAVDYDALDDRFGGGGYPGRP